MLVALKIGQYEVRCVQFVERLPTGFRVEGLTADGVAELLRKLS